MGMLDFFRQKKQEKAASHETANADITLQKQSNDEPLVIERKSPEIPEHIFVEYAKPKQTTPMEINDVTPEVSNLQTLYRHLEQNLEKKGYEDALINPDTCNMEEHVLYITNDLNLLIAKIKTYYSKYLRDIDFHIETRRRSGMIETVDELLSLKETINEEIRTVTTIETDTRQGIGLSQNVILSYKKGFRNGFAAITYNNILSRK